MTFLPIVQRELRAATRRKSTRRVRWWTAVLAMVVCFFSLLMVLLGGGPRDVGSGLFTVFTSYAFGLSLFAGLYLTADCLSQEKREGTLGLLFLTNLKGCDVVLGKFMVRSLNAFFALLSLLPIVAIPLLLGGVVVAEFWRMALALLNTLFFSLSAGLCVSAFARESQRALCGAFVLLLACVAGLPLFDALVSSTHPAVKWSYAAWLSPFYPFAYARESGYLGQPFKFWGTLVASNLLAWLFLGLASAVLPRIWRGEDLLSWEASGALNRIWPWRANRSSEQRLKRRAVLDKNPVTWLMTARPGLGRGPWLIVIAWGVAVALGCWFMPENSGWAYMVAQPCAFVLKLLVANESCRFFAEARRTGALELLLCTPLRNGELLRGHSLALKRTFLWPFLVFVLLGFFPIGFQMYTVMQRHEADSLENLAGTLAVGAAAMGWFLVRMGADIFAVIWFGRWLALIGRNPGFAAPLTILFVLVLPSVAICGLDLLADFIFIIWGASQLQQDIRWLVARQYQQPAARA